MDDSPFGNKKVLPLGVETDVEQSVTITFRQNDLDEVNADKGSSRRNAKDFTVTSSFRVLDELQ